MTSKPRVQNKSPRMPSMEEREKATLRQCIQARAQLEEAISGVMRAETQLKDNSREVKSQLHSCISRHLEVLRSREVWLLGQIDLVEQLKGEALQHQLQQLHWLRGQFDVCIHHLETSNSSHGLANQLTSCMEKLSSLNLAPEEKPDMSFQADTRSLRQAITSFGTIATQHMEGGPMLSSPPQSSSPSHASQRPWLHQSCPVTAKKQKTESGALADWLLGTRPVTTAPVGYQSSKNPQDWLMAHREAQVACPALALFDFHKAWGQLKDLEVWLLKEKAPVNRERANSNASTSSSSFSIEKIDESEFNVALEEEEEVGEAREESRSETEEPDDWLITPATAAMETVSDSDHWKQVFKPFQESWSSSEWLPKPTATDCSSCCQTRTKAVEIENLGKLKCLKTPPATTPATPSSTASTPQTPQPSSNPTPSHLELWLQQAIPIQQNCKANQTCVSYSQCVCDENCGKEALGSWLLKEGGRDKNGVPLDKNSSTNLSLDLGLSSKPSSLHQKEQQQKVHAILEAWLHPSKASSPSFPALALGSDLSSLSNWVTVPEEEKASREEQSSHFKNSLENRFHSPLQAERWVVPEKRSHSSTTVPSQEVTREQPNTETKEDKWLLRKRTQAQERLVLPTVCDLFSCMKIGGDKEKWLHKAPIQM